MTHVLVRARRAVAQLPGRLLRALGISPEGGYLDAQTYEDDRRHASETWRRGVDEDPPSDSH
jgi:hypothetical protein